MAGMIGASRRREGPSTARLQSGPWLGVRNTTDIDENVTAAEHLFDALNLFIPDPVGGSGVYARPGMALLNAGAPLVTSATPFRGQGVFAHTDLDGTTYNFVVFRGKLFRVDGTLSTFTDVTPVGVTIDNAVTTRVYGTSFVNQLAITDGVNRPWLATNLSSTPITGTYIDFDGSGTAWTAFGPAVPYGGSVFWVLGSYNSVSARTDIAWSASGDASVGYQQATYDNRWTLLQTATDAIFALAGTNVALYYWRARSIGAIAGQVGPDLQTTATHDASKANVGTQSPQSVMSFTDEESGATVIYFTDAVGRPYRMTQGGALTPIWLDMRALVDAATVGYPGITKTVTTATIEPQLNLYLVAIWSTIPSQTGPAVEAHAFDAKSGKYLGRWRVADGVQIESMGTFTDSNGRGVLVILGSADAPSTSTLQASGYVWSLNSLTAVGDYLTTEGDDQLTTEDGDFLTTEGTPANWQDDDAVPAIFAQTTRLGYDIDRVLVPDRVSALVGTTAPCQVSIQTAAVALTSQGTPTPSTVQDGVSRLVVGAAGIQGRGVEVKVAPTTADSQWSLQQISVDAAVMVAPPDEA